MRKTDVLLGIVLPIAALLLSACVLAAVRSRLVWQLAVVFTEQRTALHWLASAFSSPAAVAAAFIASVVALLTVVALISRPERRRGLLYCGLMLSIMAVLMAAGAIDLRELINDISQH